MEIVKWQYGQRVIGNPTLAIKAGSSAVAKISTAYYYVDTDKELNLVAAGDCPALAGGNLATGYTRVCMLEVDITTGTDAWKYSSDIANGELNLDDFPTLDDNNVLIGFLIIHNATGSNFVPATTALDVASLTVTYIQATDFMYLVDL